VRLRPPQAAWTKALRIAGLIVIASDDAERFHKLLHFAECNHRQISEPQSRSLEIAFSMPRKAQPGLQTLVEPVKYC
jgi:hypothetical protein